MRQDKLSADASPVSVSQPGLIRLSGPARAIALDVLRINSLQTGAYVSHFKGRGMEFDESRPYQPGDDPRNIDWRVTARSSEAYTKLFREEREGAQEDDAEGDREATRVAGGVAGVHSPQGHRAIVSWISSRSRPSTRG